MGMIGHFGAGLFWACVMVDDCCNPSSVGTLIHVKSLEKGLLSTLLPPTVRNL
jgi:hypothetical protein